MRAILLAGAMLGALVAPGHATEYSVARCTIANGQTFEWAMHEGHGIIRWDGRGQWHSVFSRRSGDIAVVTQIGNRGTAQVALNLRTGRAFIRTQFDNGKTVQNDVACRLTREDF